MIDTDGSKLNGLAYITTITVIGLSSCLICKV